MNNISTLEPFGQLVNLQELYLRKNKISDIQEVNYLSRCKRLKVLWLLENPISQMSDYRLRVIAAVPWLHKLDNAEVTQAEVMTAQELLGALSNSEDQFKAGSPSQSHQEQQQQQQQQQLNQQNAYHQEQNTFHQQHYTSQTTNSNQNHHRPSVGFLPKTPAQVAMEAILSSSQYSPSTSVMYSPMQPNVSSPTTPAPTPLSPPSTANVRRESRPQSANGYSPLRSYSVHQPVINGNNGPSIQQQGEIPESRRVSSAADPSSVASSSNNRQWAMEGKDRVNQRIRASSQVGHAPPPQPPPPILTHINKSTSSSSNSSNGSNGNVAPVRINNNNNVVQAILTLSQGLQRQDLAYLQDRISKMLLEEQQHNHQHQQ